MICITVFTRVHHVHYLSSSNSPVPVRIGSHTRKGRAFILLVMTNFYYLYPNSSYLQPLTLPYNFTRVPELTQ